MPLFTLAVLCTAQTAGHLPDLPGVAKVEATEVADKPAHYLIHILDWHFADKDSFIADLRDHHEQVVWPRPAVEQ